jgi:SHS2 domain-containing protein
MRGIVVHAEDLKELFARAAWGMFSVITDVNAVKPAEKTRISVEASDRHALMVNWLSELNYRHVTEHRLFCRFDVSTVTEQRLEAEVHGEKTDHERNQEHE